MAQEWRFPCEFLGNYDGDTIDLRVDLGFGIQHVINVRLHGVDTPEIRGGEDLVKQAGFLARDRVRQFVAGKSLHYRSIKWNGKYGRPLGDIEADGASLCDYLLENRLAVAYQGGSRGELLAQHLANAKWLREEGYI